MPGLPRKKTASEIHAAALTEPAMTDDDWREYREGWRLFNERRFWHSHEAWENVWRRHREESRIFFQGIIQLAAAYHLLLMKRRYGGTMRNFDKAEEKLRLFQGRFLGVDVGRLLQGIDQARGEISRIGRDHLDQFDPSQIPAVPL